MRLSAKQIKRLKLLHNTLRNRKLADRVKSVVLHGGGWSIANVAQALLIVETTVRNWLDIY